MKLKSIILTLFIAAFHFAYAQSGSVKGFVYNSNSDETVPFANVVLKGTSLGAVATADGYFVINNVQPGIYTLEVSFVGFESFTKQIKLTSMGIVSVKAYLKPTSEILQDVEVSAERQERKTKVLTSVTTLDPKSITRFSVGGDADIIKALQVLPGVITTGDQGGQIYIRGGAPIQNLVLLDGMIVYNPFHSIGSFSVFDNDIIQSADIYTGGFNAEYGSRNSAVMDIKTRSGNRKRLAGKVSASTYTSKVLLESPLGPQNERGLSGASLLLSAKTSYLDQTSSMFYPYVETEYDGLPFTFRDIYSKLSFESDNGSQLNAFGFSFDDGVRFGGDNDINWNSFGGGLNFRVIPAASTAILAGDASYSSYDITAIEGDLFQRSTVSGFNGGLDFTYFIGKADELKFGIEAITYSTYFQVDPEVGVVVEEIDNTTELGSFFKYKYASSRLIIEPGLRVHYYGSQAKISLEPRFGLKYNINEWMRLKASGGLYSQNLLAGYNEDNVVNLFYGFLSGPLPAELQDEFRGEEVTSAIQTAQHLVTGLEFEITKNLNLNIEGYIKDFKQIINLNRNQLYSENSSLADGQPDRLTKTYILERGFAKGLDFLAKYQTKRLYIWLAYSLSEVTRDDDELLYYPTYDRRHNVNLVSNYAAGEDLEWEISFRYNFGSGFPFTATQLYFNQLDFTDNNQGSINYDYTNANGNLGVLYGDLNTNRLPNYHRVDLSVARTFEFEKSKYSKLVVTAGATNILDYDNVFYYDRVENKRVDQLPIMPTISAAYSF